MRKVMVPSGTPLAFCHEAPLLVLVNKPRPTIDVPPKAGSPVPATSVCVEGRKAMAPTICVGRLSPTECQSAPPLVVSHTPPLDEAVYQWAALAGSVAKL